MTKTYIALLRGINAGGNNSLPMKDLLQLLGKMGLKNVTTYIQTGNAAFRANEPDVAGLPDKIKARIKRNHGFAPEVVLFRLDQLENAVASNPYPEADSDPKSLHLVFLSATPKTPDLAVLERVRKETERFTLGERVSYFHAKEGVGRSKLFPRIEKSLGVVGTARNWRTACRILDTAREVAVADVATSDRGPRES